MTGEFLASSSIDMFEFTRTVRILYGSASANSLSFNRRKVFAVDMKSASAAGTFPVPRLAPDGIDVYFDNVGGPHLVAALKNMTIGGRIALCGMISQYSEDGRGQDINHLIEAVLRRVTIRGFIVRDHEDMRPEFERTVAGWLRSGEVDALQTVTDGIDHAVDAFLAMLKGGNIGKALVRLDTDWEI